MVNRWYNHANSNMWQIPKKMKSNMQAVDHHSGMPMAKSLVREVQQTKIFLGEFNSKHFEILEKLTKEKSSL
jgi:predicted hydrolase (HD superfamily)